LDLAKHSDYSVCVVSDVRERRVVAFDRFNKADWGLQKARIVAMAKRWNDALVWMDATGVGDPVYDDLRAGGLRVHPYKFTNATKTALIDNAVLMVEQQDISYPDIPELISELQSYEYQRTPAGLLRMSAPEGMHDDCVIAFSLMCMALGHRGGHIPPQAVEMLTRPISDVGGVKLMRRGAF
jgi:hypothetical protein